MNDKLTIVGKPQHGDEDLRLWLERHIAAHPHLTTNILSRSNHIGKSKTALDAYLEGTYFQSKEFGGLGVNPQSSTIEKAIQAYRERVEGTARHGYTNKFVETHSWNQFQHACKTAISENVIVVVYAKPGVGKSRCLLEYSVRKMETSPINILCSTNVTPRYFVQKIARALGLDDKPPTAKLEDNIAEKLKRNARPIFVDQANYLNEKSLGTICYIWEVARVPIVLLGTKDLYDLFTTSRMTEDVRAQLSSRVAMHYPLKELSLGEVKGIVERALGPNATAEEIAEIYSVTGGIHRHVDMIIPRYNELVKVNQADLESGQITRKAVLNAAGRRLMTG
jgi:DNA transposition AAA+ family ATPase